MDLYALIPIAAMATGVALGLPIIKAVIRNHEQKQGGVLGAGEVTAIKEELQQLHDRLDAIESDSARIAELEERLDFAERVLSQQDRPKIEKPNVPEVST